MGRLLYHTRDAMPAVSIYTVNNVFQRYYLHAINYDYRSRALIKYARVKQLQRENEVIHSKSLDVLKTE